MTVTRELLAVACLEADLARVSLFEVENKVVTRLEDEESWDPREEIGREDGIRLLDSVAQHCLRACRNRATELLGLSLSVPGTIDGNRSILRSTRLGIRTPLDVAAALNERHGIKGVVVHDTQARALGELRHGSPEDEPADAKAGERGNESFVYVLVGEGIGTAVFLNGKPYLGAGAAGHLGRMIVDPGGSYNRTFASKGPLEVFAARPWVSQNLVGEYLSEAQKRTSIEADDLASRPFRVALQAAADSNEWASIGYRQINQALGADDAIAVQVVDDAARYLGLGIAALITILNPPVIILGGGMIEQLDTFLERVVNYTRRYSWELAWERTQVRPAKLGPDAQFWGSAEVALDLLGWW